MHHFEQILLFEMCMNDLYHGNHHRREKPGTSCDINT